MVDQIRFFAGAARILEGRAGGEYMKGFTSIIRREPVGVIGQVTPWNYPMMMAVWKFAPAIAAGNTVVLKPSDTTPVTHRADGRDVRRRPARRACSTSSRATAPPVRRSWSTRARTWSRSPGRCAPAWRSRARAAQDVKRVHLELGGKAPVVVFEDADIAAAAEWLAVAGYFNAGQDCTAATRVLVADAIHDEFVAALAEQARSTTTTFAGGPTTRTRSCRPMNNEQPDGAGPRVPRPDARRTPRSSPAASVRATAASSSRRRSSPACARTTRWSRTRSSARSSRCSASPTRPRRWRGPTTCSTAWRRRCGRRTSPARMRMAKYLRLRLPCGSTPTSRWSPRCRTAGSSTPGYGKDLSMYGFEDYTRIKHVMISLDEG